MNPMNIVKFIGSWFCTVAAVTLLILGHEVFGLPGVLFLGSIAFSQAPANV